MISLSKVLQHRYRQVIEPAGHWKLEAKRGCFTLHQSLWLAENPKLGVWFHSTMVEIHNVSSVCSIVMYDGLQWSSKARDNTMVLTLDFRGGNDKTDNTRGNSTNHVPPRFSSKKRLKFVCILYHQHVEPGTCWPLGILGQFPNGRASPGRFGPISFPRYILTN